MREASVAELIALFPPNTHDALWSQFAQRVLPPVTPPLGRHIQRVMDIPGRALRLMAAVRLIAASADRLSYSARQILVAQSERFGEIVRPEEEVDCAAVTRALDEYAEGVRLPLDMPRVRARTAAMYTRSVHRAGELATRMIGPEARQVVDMMPARHADEIGFSSKMADLERDLGPGPQDTEDRVLALLPQLPAMVAAADNRLAMIERMLADCAVALRGSRTLLDAGGRLTVSCRTPVVRRDESLGDGDQIVRLSIMREDAMLRDALRHAPEDPEVLWRLGEGPHPQRAMGRYLRASKLDRVRIVYEGVDPIVPGGETVEPFLVHLFRLGAFEPEQASSVETSDERRRILVELGLKAENNFTAGFMTDTGSSAQTRAAYHRLVTTGGGVCLPLLSFFHAMAFARLVFRFGVRSGARLGEIMQLRVGSDAFGRHVVAGRSIPFVWLKPKGWADFGKFGTDMEMLRTIRQLVLLAHKRWHPDLFDDEGKPTIPSVKFGDPMRDADIPNARYILSGATRAIRQGCLMTFVRVLLHEAVHDIETGEISAHDKRRLFATALGIRATSYDQMGALLHHRPGSFTTVLYDFSGKAAAVGAAASFNAELETGLAGLVDED